MKIKGHSIIELKDVNTGEIERYEDDNIVTNALSMFLQDIGTLGVSPLISGNLKSDPLNNLLGGLLLFDTEIQENANTVLTPGGIKMIGNGSYNVSADGEEGVTELGSWDAAESGWTSDGKYTLSWDFTDSQANCKPNQSIKCICLTSANHGYIGEGNQNPDFASRSNKRGEYAFEGETQPYMVDDNSNELTRFINISMTDSTIRYVENYNINYNASYAEEHMSSTGKLKVITQKIPLSKFDMRMSYPMGNTEGQSFIPVDETELTLPPDFLTQLGSRTPYLSGRHGDYYYMLASDLNRLASGGTVYGVKINCSTLEVTGFTITNTIGYQWGVDSTFVVMFGNNTVAFPVTFREDGVDKRKFLFQDLTQNEDTELVDVSIIGNKDHMHEESCKFGGCKVDFVDRSVLPTNGDDSGKCLGVSLLNDNPLIRDHMHYIVNQGWIGQELRLVHATDYLATINNLQTPVVKSSNKSMKVTYVLSFDDGE